MTTAPSSQAAISHDEAYLSDAMLRLARVTVHPVTYDWVSEVEAVAITYVRGQDLQQVGDLLSFNWACEQPTRFAEAENQQDPHGGTHRVQVIQVESQRGSWLVLVEPNGYLASLPDALEALGEADVALSVYWNVNAQMRFAMYADGILIRSFDPLLPHLGPEGKPLREEEGLSFGTEGDDPRGLAMLLAERLTTVEVGRDWILDTAHSTWTARGYNIE